MIETASIIKVVEGQIVVQQELQLFLQHLRQQAAPIVVHDRDTYGEALEIVKQADDAVKQVIAAAEPERLALRKRLEDLLADRDKIVAQILTVTESLSKTAREWNIAEKQAAQRETDRINREAIAAAEKQNKGKRAENRIAPTLSRVVPDIPKIPGKRIVAHWRYEVIDFSKLKPQFKIDDKVLIGAELRKINDKEKAEKAIGGIRAWQE